MARSPGPIARLAHDLKHPTKCWLARLSHHPTGRGKRGDIVREKGKRGSITYLDLLTGLKIILYDAEEIADAVKEQLDQHEIEAPELSDARKFISEALDLICEAIERHKIILEREIYDKW